MTILCYHGVELAWSSPLAIKPMDFSGHLLWLTRHRQVIDVHEGVALLDRRGRLPRGTIALTFDDGFASIAEHALPLLTRQRIPATVFLVAGTLTDPAHPVDWVDDPPAHPISTLNREQVVELSKNGIRFGSHGMTHRDLTQLTDDECVRELRQSRETIEDVVGMHVHHLAYPRGRHDSMVWRAAHRAGFTNAFSLPDQREPIGPYAVPRVGVYRGNGLWTLRLKTREQYLSVRATPLHSALRSLLRLVDPPEPPG